jgi:hypothetical protein
MADILRGLADGADSAMSTYMLISLLSIISIAATSIGVECYNSTGFSKGNNKKFMVLILSISVIALGTAGLSIVLAYARRFGAITL